MPDYDTYTVFGATYADTEGAEADYEAVKALYYGWDAMDTFDAAVVTKRDDGKVKIVKKHEQPTRKGGWRGAGIGLAAGAVIALFPAAAIGSGLLVGMTAGGATLGAIAGHVTGGMSRGDLKDLGDQLDAGQTGLVVVAATDVASRVREALEAASDILEKELQALLDELDAEVSAAEAEAESEAKAEAESED